MLFFFNDTATTEIYTLSLHDALPISRCPGCGTVLTGGMLETLWQLAALSRGLGRHACDCGHPEMRLLPDGVLDRKSTRLNSSHANISYAVFCLKKKNLPKFPTLCSLL